MSLDPIVQDAVHFVLNYATSTNNWLSVKKEILWKLPCWKRKEFSKRHYSSKKHIINAFEQQIIDYWYDSTGIALTIPEDKMHDVSWTRHKRGWGLKVYNRMRQKAAAKRKKNEQRAKRKKAA